MYKHAVSKGSMLAFFVEVNFTLSFWHCECDGCVDYVCMRTSVVYGIWPSNVYVKSVATLSNL